jgi:F0F1-type ATP synthase gamma subunit
VTEDFLAEKYDEIDIAYSTFVSTLSQKPAIDTILPVVSPEMAEDQERTNDEYLFEPSPEAVLSGCCRTTWPSASIGPCWRTTHPSSRRA